MSVDYQIVAKPSSMNSYNEKTMTQQPVTGVIPAERMVVLELPMPHNPGCAVHQD